MPAWRVVEAVYLAISVGGALYAAWELLALRRERPRP